MLKIVESESVKMGMKIGNIDKMEIKKIYDKAQILPNLIETCRSFCLTPLDFKIFLVDITKSKSIIDKLKQFNRNI